MATAPARIQVLRFLENEEMPCSETLNTHQENIRPSIPPQDPESRNEWDETMAERQATEARGQVVSHWNEYGFQPDISLLPSIESWHGDAWQNRAVLPMSIPGGDTYHMLFTKLNSEEHMNRHANRRVRGDLYILKVSERKDQGGRRFYEDLRPNMRSEELEPLIETVSAMLRNWWC